MGDCMINKIVLQIQKICPAAKISVLLGSILASVMFLAAILMRLFFTGGLDFKYLYEQIAFIASKIFAMGIFLGLSGDFLMVAVDSRRK